MIMIEKVMMKKIVMKKIKHRNFFFGMEGGDVSNFLILGVRKYIFRVFFFLLFELGKFPNEICFLKKLHFPKYAISFFLRKYKNFFNLRAGKFHF